MRFPLRDQSGFPARRRTGIEYPLTRGQAQGKCDALRSQILDGYQTVGKPGEVVHVARQIQSHGVRHPRFRASADPGHPQHLQILAGRGALTIDAQPHRRTLSVARSQQLRPTHRPIGAQAIGEPHRRSMASGRIAGDFRIQALALAQIPA